MIHMNGIRREELIQTILRKMAPPLGAHHVPFAHSLAATSS